MKPSHSIVAIDGSTMADTACYGLISPSTGWRPTIFFRLDYGGHGLFFVITALSFHITVHKCTFNFGSKISYITTWFTTWSSVNYLVSGLVSGFITGR